jgi:hypothetical protein
MYLQMSVDGGAWQQLGTFNTGQNWYNSSSQTGTLWWSGDSGLPAQWSTAAHDLFAVHGRFVQLRFVFASSSMDELEGFGIDDLRIVCSECPANLFPGTQEDLVLLSSINSAPLTPIDWKSVQAGDVVDLLMLSPGETFTGQPWVMLLTPFDPAGGATVPAFRPGLYGTGQTLGLGVPGLLLPSAGGSIGLVWPAGASSTAVLAQGLVPTALGTRNGLFAATDGHVLEQR